METQLPTAWMGWGGCRHLRNCLPEHVDASSPSHRLVNFSLIFQLPHPLHVWCQALIPESCRGERHMAWGERHEREEIFSSWLSHGCLGSSQCWDALWEPTGCTLTPLLSGPCHRHRSHGVLCSSFTGPPKSLVFSAESLGTNQGACFPG